MTTEDLKGDRFKKIQGNYNELFDEVFQEQGMDYEGLQKEVFNTVAKLEPNFKNLPILDIGVGDGATSRPFIEAGAKDITGIDLNPEMLEAAKNKFGDSIKLKQVNAIDVGSLKDNNFEIVIAGMAIHNISREQRLSFWKGLLALNSKIIVLFEKIKDADSSKYKLALDSELAAVRKVYGEKHGLQTIMEEWIKHYEDDERESLDMAEIHKNLDNDYVVEVTNEVGLCKIVLAQKR